MTFWITGSGLSGRITATPPGPGGSATPGHRKVDERRVERIVVGVCRLIAPRRLPGHYQAVLMTVKVVALAAGFRINNIANPAYRIMLVFMA